MIALDQTVKTFIDNNWLAMGILLILLKSIASQFNAKIFQKIYMVLNNALHFIRPPSSDVQTKLDNISANPSNIPITQEVKPNNVTNNAIVTPVPDNKNE